MNNFKLNDKVILLSLQNADNTPYPYGKYYIGKQGILSKEHIGLFDFFITFSDGKSFAVNENNIRQFYNSELIEELINEV
mgnify:CR=1 FL=1